MLYVKGYPSKWELHLFLVAFHFFSYHYINLNIFLLLNSPFPLSSLISFLCLFPQSILLGYLTMSRVITWVNSLQRANATKLNKKQKKLQKSIQSLHKYSPVSINIFPATRSTAVSVVTLGSMSAEIIQEGHVLLTIYLLSEGTY